MRRAETIVKSIDDRAIGKPLADRSVLYVAAATSKKALGDFARELPRARAGRVLWVETESALDETQAALREGGDGVRAVCLIGDHRTLPFARLDDPCGFDSALLSDSPYGMHRTPSLEERFAGELLPLVPVTRVPALDGRLVERLLGAAEDDARERSWRGGVVVSAAVWREATTAVLRSLETDVDLTLSPPGARGDVEDQLSRRPARVLFNVHGTDQDAVWLGEGEGVFPEVLRVADVNVADNALVVSEACYGASLADGGDAIAPRFLAAGASCFFGSTIIAWGSSRGGPPALADDLAREIFHALDAGDDAGQALARARHALLEAALSSGEGLSAPLHNTLLSFVAYGAPGRATDLGQGKVTSAQRSDVLAEARESLRRRMAPAAWRLVSSGRVAFAALAQTYGAMVTDALRDLLGATPADARVVKYLAISGERATVLASARSGGRVRHAIVELTAAGQVARRLVSR